jgi:hypothetical protein
MVENHCNITFYIDINLKKNGYSKRFIVFITPLCLNMKSVSPVCTVVQLYT